MDGDAAVDADCTYAYVSTLTQSHVFPVSETGMYTTLLQGLLLGFFFPLLPFFYMRPQRVDAFFSDAYQGVEGHGSVVFS